MRIYCDLQAVQSLANPDRGIARYVAEFARAVEQNHPGAVEGWLLNPSLPTPAHLPELMWGGKVRSQDDPDLTPPDVWHVLSPFEDDNINGLLNWVWPTWARTSRTRLVVTLYDLIPLIYADRYLAHPSSRTSYTRRLRMIQRADQILAISEATAADAVRLLGIPPKRIDVVGTGVSEHFVPSNDLESTRASLGDSLPALRPGYVLYTGGIDFRKNIDGLLNAYARLPAPLRAAHQLVIVCSVGPGEREHYEQRARALGVGQDFLMTGFVPDDVLLQVYQAAHLFVFPSLYEGFGLPVVEALACGVPAIVGRNSSLTELVDDPNAWFDAAVADDITRALFRALTDEPFRRSLIRSADEDYRWNVVAERSLASYARTVQRRTARADQARIALVGPMPPVRSGVADYSDHLLRALSGRAVVDVFTTPEATRTAIPGVRWFTYDELSSAIRLYGAYDDTVFAMGNSEHHFEVLEQLRLHGGTVMAHDVRYTGLFSAALTDRPQLLDEHVREMLPRLFAQQLPEKLARYPKVSPGSYYRVNELLTGQVTGPAEAVFVHSATAAALARLNAPPADRSKVDVLPFGHVVRDDLRSRPRDAVVSLGIVDRIKRSDVVLEAFILLAHQFPDLRLALVGACPDTALWEELRARVLAAGLADRITLTGRADEGTYTDWLGRAEVAVQLRAHSNGETSAAVADCLGAAVPTLVSRTGAMAELGDACVQVDPDASASEVARTVAVLLQDPVQRSAAAGRGFSYAVAHSFEKVADAIIARAELRRRTPRDDQSSAIRSSP